MKNYDYGIIIIIIVIILLVFWYYYFVDHNPVNLIYTKGQMENYNSYDSTDLNKYQIIKFNDNYVPLKNNNAIIIYGNITKEFKYFSINSYIWDYKDNVKIIAPITDPISTADLYSLPYGKIIITIFTSNILLYDEISKHLSREFKNKMHKIFPMIIPTDVNNLNANYTIICNTLFNNKNDEFPYYQTRLYTSNNTKFSDKKIPYIKKNDKSSFSEYDIINSTIWNNKSLNIVQNEIFNLNILKTINLNPYPNTIYCINNNINCKENNYDITSLTTDNIYLNENLNIIIVAVDHSISGLSMLSMINIFDLDQNKIVETHVTGDGSYKKLEKNKIICKVIKIDQKYKNIKIEEKIYINHETKTAPNFDTILPIKIFIY